MTGVPQDLDSESAPTHGAPQAFPATHVRVLVWVPAPHFTEHAPHAPKAPSLLSTIAVPQDLDSESAPTHGAPHAFPATHDRVLVCVPVPHLTEQAPHAPKAPSLLSTAAIPQDRDSELGPEHGAPHGSALMHTRLLVCVPVPHLTEHALHAPYAPYLPFTTAVPQDRVAVYAPLHDAPPLAGAGQPQVRDCVCVPIPQLTVHALHAP